ncbi:hypothetical protein ACE1SV_62830 [Streptomyces sennicomposti]
MRTAGHVMGPEVLGSIEFGAEVLGCPRAVILGHDSCGAVGAACAALEDGVTPAGYVRDVVERVTPNVLAARAAGRGEPEENLAERIKHTDLLLDRSRVLADKVAAARPPWWACATAWPTAAHSSSPPVAAPRPPPPR